MGKIVDFLKNNVMNLTFSIIGLGISLFCMIYFNVEIHKICPFVLVCTGTLSIEKGIFLFSSGVFLSIAVIFISYMFRRLFCGYVCPIGYIQRLSSWIAEIFKIKRIKLSKKVDYLLKVKKIVLIVLLIFGITITGRMLFIDICPIYMFSSFMYIGVSTGAVVVILLIFILSIKIEYYFCKYLCPYSVLINIGGMFLEKIGVKKIRVLERDKNSCISCNICTNKCPMEIEITMYEDDVDSKLCIACMKCVDSCPMNKKGKNTLSYKKRG